jgi:hypothetical protein
MDEFNRVLSQWQPFYSVVASVSATLVGLLFVSLSINRERITKHDDKSLMRLATRGCGDLLFVLMIALMMLVPMQPSYGLAVALVVIGVTRSAELFKSARSPNPANPIGGRFRVLREHGLPLVACFGLVAVGIAVAGGYYFTLTFLVPVIAAMLTTVCWNAWLLLVLDDTEKP